MQINGGSDIPRALLSYQVVSGLVELRVARRDGATPIARLCGPGTQICPADLDGFVAVARLPTQLRAVSQDDYVGFARDFSRILGLHAPQPAVDKLWELLCLYQQAFSHARGAETYALPLATFDFAASLGLELRTVSRALAELKLRGLVQRKSSGLWSVSAQLQKTA